MPLSRGASIVLGVSVLSALGEVAITATAQAEDDATTSMTLVHNRAFAEQLRLLHPDASVEQLALTEDDVQYVGITVDEYTGDVYFASSDSAIHRARYDSSLPTGWGVTTVIGGRVEVHVSGYNLGASMDDIVSFSIRGVECSTLKRESSNSLVCVSGHPALTVDLGKGITADDVTVQTAIGGWTGGGYIGDFVDTKLADHSLKPIITRVEAAGHKITPRALSFDSTNRRLYYSDINKRTIERIRYESSDDSYVVEFGTFRSGVGLVFGMAIDPEEGDSGGFLYFSDTQSGTVSRIELPVVADDNEGQRAELEVLVAGLIDPMGIALEPNNGPRLFFTLRGGSIRAVSRDSSTSSGNFVPKAAELADGSYEVRRFDSGTRLDGIAISEAVADDLTGLEDPTEPRLYWSESGRHPGLKRSTIDGTRVESISVSFYDVDGSIESGGSSNNNALSTRLIWPRGVVFGAGASDGLLVCERLGAVRLLYLPDSGHDMVGGTVVEADSYPAGAAVRTLIGRAGKEGVGDTYFTEGLS